MPPKKTFFSDCPCPFPAFPELFSALPACRNFFLSFRLALLRSGRPAVLCFPLPFAGVFSPRARMAQPASLLSKEKFPRSRTGAESFRPERCPGLSGPALSMSLRASSSAGSVSSLCNLRGCEETSYGGMIPPYHYNLRKRKASGGPECLHPYLRDPPSARGKTPAGSFSSSVPEDRSDVSVKTGGRNRLSSALPPAGMTFLPEAGAVLSPAKTPVSHGADGHPRA